jgi:MATE family multidrug resistance protein
MVNFQTRLKEVALFSIPIVAGQIGQMFFGIGDIMVAGRYSNEVVAALGVATGIFAPFIMVGLGITYAVSAIASQRRGKGQKLEDLIGSSLLAIHIAGAFLLISLFTLIFNLDVLALPEAINSKVVTYLYWAGASLFPVMLFQVFKEYLQAYDDTYFANGTILVFNIINIGMNIVLMFGFGPIPELGIKGAAIATLISRSLMAVVIYRYTIKKHPFPFISSKGTVKSVLSLGIPISLSTLIEVSLFSVVTVLIGKMTVTASASHSIVLNLASLTFMVPLALASVASVKVGGAYGKEDPRELLQYTQATEFLAVTFMCFTALCYFLIPDLLLRFATSDPALLKYGASMLVFVAFFQIPDGIQVTMSGVLRGMGVTKEVMFFALISNWVIGLPVGHYFAVTRGMEAAGYWAGLATGLTVMCLFLSFVFYRRYNAFKKSIHQT